MSSSARLEGSQTARDGSFPGHSYSSGSNHPGQWYMRCSTLPATSSDRLCSPTCSTLIPQARSLWSPPTKDSNRSSLPDATSIPDVAVRRSASRPSRSFARRRANSMRTSLAHLREFDLPLILRGNASFQVRAHGGRCSRSRTGPRGRTRSRPARSGRRMLSGLSAQPMGATRFPLLSLATASSDRMANSPASVADFLSSDGCSISK